MTRMLNRGNEELIDATLRRLELATGDRVLDVGFGGGLALSRAVREIGSGHVVGIDPSEDAVAQARRRFADLIDSGRLQIRCTGVEGLDEEATFDKIITTNTIYFWPRLDAAFAAMARALAPGGRLCVGFSGRRKMTRFDRITRHGFHLHEDHAVADAAEAAGLDAELLEQRGRRITGDFVLRATKPK
jgi:cyclopropane fatty-acyl-phospholipid synthase-like methyltransferase